MKRPFAVIGSSMLIAFLVVSNITHKMTIALLTGAVVIFSCFLIFKTLRKYLSVIFALIGVITFTFSFIGAEKYYLNEMESFENEQILTGVVCEIPTDSDYAFSYIIKPDNKNYKVRFVTEENRLIREGDCVKLSVINCEEYTETDILEHSLSSKVYFTFFGSDECIIEKTGEINYFYKTVGKVKREVSEIIVNYLPSSNGAIATAMTIGERAEIDDSVIDYFNYSGTSHLLVISGLHLTLWSVSIMNFLNKFSKTRKYSHIIGIFCLLAYSSITGFSVSVIRAGTMVGATLVSRFFRRDADSLNSIGLAVAFILLENPFAPKSVSLWLTVLSTVGIIVYSGKIESWIREKFNNRPIAKSPLYSSVLTAFSISFSTAVFTLPVFIYKLKMMPILSIPANFIMVTPAMVMMALTILGVVCHLFSLGFFSRICFFIVGIIGEWLHFSSEKIGALKWSTISLDHSFYKSFFALLLIAIGIVVILKKYKVDMLKQITLLMSVVFCIVAVFCTYYDYNNPSIEVLFTDNKPVITVFSKGESTLIGVQKKKYVTTIENMLRKHNEKQLDNIIVTAKEQKTPSQLIYLYEKFGNAQTYYSDEIIGLFKDNSTAFTTDLTLSENVNIDFCDCDMIEITVNGKSVLVMDCKKIQNIYENDKNYDIILVYGKKSYEFEKELEDRFEYSEIIISEEGKTISVT